MNLQSLLAIGAAFRAGLQVLPDAITAAEAFFPAGGNGATKAEIVKAKVKAYLELLGHGAEAVGNALPAILSAVSGIVAALNAAGVLHKSKAGG